MGLRFLVAACFGLLALLASGSAAAAGTPVSGIRMFVDADGQLGPAQVAAIADAGGMTPTEHPRLPFTITQPDRALWLRFDVPPDPHGAERVLEVARPVFDRVQLFSRGADGRWQASAELGASIPFATRPVDHRSFVFPLRTPPGTTVPMLLRAEFPGGAAIRLTLWEPRDLAASALPEIAIFSLYFGLAGGMLLYVVLLNFVVRDRGYLLYAGMVAATAAGTAVHSGMGAQFVWGDWTWWNSHGMYLSYSLAFAFGLALTRRFLRTRERVPRMDRLLAAGCRLLAANAILAATVPHIAAPILVAISVVFPVILTGLAILAAVRRWPGAPYFLAAWLCFHAGVLLFQLRPLGIDNLLTANSVMIGSALEMILLSLALADRMNEERRQKEKAQALTLGIVQAQNAFASETRLGRLHERVCEVMARIAGAKDVRFLLHDEDGTDWLLKGDGERLRRIPLAEAAAAGEVSQAAFDQARASGKAVREAGLLAVPVTHQGEVIAVLELHGCGEHPPASMDAIESVATGLALSLENVLLYERLEQRVEARTRKLQEAQLQLVAAARAAGMAEIATNVLHNVGNTLNSVNVAADLMRRRMTNSRLPRLRKAVELFPQRTQELAAFLLDDEKGRVLPRYLSELVPALEEERSELLAHLDDLRKSVEHINNVVAVQQSYVGLSTFMESVRPGELVEDALRIVDGSFQGEAVDLVKELADMPPMQLDRVRAIQILVNLLTNARQALKGMATDRNAMTVRVSKAEGQLRFEVQDRGCGIPAENLGRIFAHGFTTREDGHGFGLHSCAVAAREMGGTLTASSEGPGRGATFTLDLPMQAA